MCRVCQMVLVGRISNQCGTFREPRSCKFIDAFQQVRSQLDIGGFRIFNYPICAAGSWYGKDILSLVKQPCQGELSRSHAEFFCEL